jgi:hypothetical protein
MDSIVRTHIQQRFRLPSSHPYGYQLLGKVWGWIGVQVIPSVHRRLVSATRPRLRSHHLEIALFRCQVSWTFRRRRRPASSPLSLARRTTRCCRKRRFRSCTRCRIMRAKVTIWISRFLQLACHHRTMDRGLMLFDCHFSLMLHNMPYVFPVFPLSCLYYLCTYTYLVSTERLPSVRFMSCRFWSGAAFFSSCGRSCASFSSRVHDVLLQLIPNRLALSIAKVGQEKGSAKQVWQSW